jgi:chemotaxis protein CheD
MNHFMLPSPLPRSHFFSTDEGRFGIYAMEMLVNDLLGLGAARSRLAAKVFGGGNVLKLSSEAGGRIGDSNVLFAREFLGAEGIPIVAQDTGGTRGRKILFDTRTGDVWVRKLKGDAFAAVLEAEEAYGDSRRAGASGGVTLFVAPPQRR